MHRTRILLGTLLIGLGGVFLLRAAGVIPEDIHFWPLLLIVLGIWLFVVEDRWSPPIGSLVLVVVGGSFLLRDLGVVTDVGNLLWPMILIAVGVALLYGTPRRRRRRRGPGEGPEPEVVLEAVRLEGASQAHLRIDYGAGRLVIEDGPEGAELAAGRFTGGVTTDVKREGDRLRVRLKQPSLERVIRGRSLDWTLGLHPGIPMVLELHTGAHDGRYDLRRLQVREITIETGASNTDLTLPERGRVDVRIEAGAAKVRIRVPTTLAARIESSTALAEVRVDTARFPGGGGRFESPGFADAEDRADIRIEGGVGSFHVS